MTLSPSNRSVWPRIKNILVTIPFYHDDVVRVNKRQLAGTITATRRTIEETLKKLKLCQNPESGLEQAEVQQ